MASTTTGGVGGTAAGALSSIGSDLSVSISFSIAQTLLEAGNEEQLSPEELIAIVLGFAIVFSALQLRIGSELAARKDRAVAAARADAHAHVLAFRARIPSITSNDNGLAELVSTEFEQAVVAEAARTAIEKLADRKSLLDFVYLLVSIASRITVAISVQLLAAAVKLDQPSRLTRTVSLLSLASFFVFLESIGHRHL